MGNVFTQKMQMHKKKDKEIMYIKKKSILQVEVHQITMSYTQNPNPDLLHRSAQATEHKKSKI